MVIRFSALAVLAAIFVLCASPSVTAQAPAPAASTRSLYTFHRDDAAPVTHIRINAAHTGTTPLSPSVCGNFIEHLFDVVYQILWADAILNPNLERSDPHELQPPYWDEAGNVAWQQDGGYLSPRCVRLLAPDGQLSQRLSLPSYRTQRYTLTLFTRGNGQITVTLHGGNDLNGRVLAQTALNATGVDWHAQIVHWDLSAGPLAAGYLSRIAFAHTGGGAVDVDQIEVFPDDAVDGMDPDVVKLAQAWHIPVLRLAGNFSSGYHWRDGVGPRLARPTAKNEAWGGPDSNHFGTDEFLDLAARLGATPQIGVNAGNGKPDEAAAWVTYCNAVTERVPVWEIGNELYGGWQIGHTDAPGYAARFVQFRDAMLKADPRIQIIANGKGEEFLPEGIGRDRAWNLALLRAAVAQNGQPPDWLSIHPLVGLPGDLGGKSYEERWESAMAHPYFLDQTLIPEFEQEITSVEGPNARTRIAPTEWGIIANGGGDWRDGPTHDAEAGAVYNALALNTFLRNGDWVTLANMTALLHGGSIKKDSGVPYVDPQYYPNQLYALAAPRIPVLTDSDGPGRDVPQRGFLPAAKDVPDVDVFSALTADRKRLVLFAVNRTLRAPRPVKIDMQGFAASRVSATILTSGDPQTGNSWERPDNVAPHPFPLSKGSPRNGWTVTLPPHSLIVFTFARKSGGK